MNEVLSLLRNPTAILALIGAICTCASLVEPLVAKRAPRLGAVLRLVAAVGPDPAAAWRRTLRLNVARQAAARVAIDRASDRLIAAASAAPAKTAAETQARAVDVGRGPAPPAAATPPPVAP